MSVEAFPLQWPEGWPRTPYLRRDSNKRFRGSVYGQVNIGRARDQLLAELSLLGAKSVVISSNLPVRLEGLPYANARPVNDDPGVAVYFTIQKRQFVMARDKFSSVAGNLRSLTLAISAMRQLQRHGGDRMMERAFTGFAAITPPDWKKPWREVFGVKPDWTGDITALDTLMAELNVAYEEARQRARCRSMMRFLKRLFAENRGHDLRLTVSPWRITISLRRRWLADLAKRGGPAGTSARRLVDRLNETGLRGDWGGPEEIDGEEAVGDLVVILQQISGGR